MLYLEFTSQVSADLRTVLGVKPMERRRRTGSGVNAFRMRLQRNSARCRFGSEAGDPLPAEFIPAKGALEEEAARRALPRLGDKPVFNPRGSPWLAG